jgi:hypothetical protein
MHLTLQIGKQLLKCRRYIWSFRVVVLPTLAIAALSSCANGGVRYDKPIPPLAFSCPVGISTVLSDQTGKKRRIDWLGADPSDPNLCVSAGPIARRTGVPDKKLFARWALNTISGTTDEVAQFRTSVGQFMHGQAQIA